MKQIMNYLLIGLIFCVGVMITPGEKVFAIKTDTNDRVYLAANTDIDESLVAVSSDIRIDGTIHGDLFCLGKNITITGFVDGDILCAGQNITIEGTSSGDIRLLGQEIGIKGSIGKSLTVASQRLDYSGNTHTDSLFIAQNMFLGGVTGRDITGFGEMILLQGMVQRNVTLTAESVKLSSSSSVSGTLRYESPKDAEIQNGATIGKIEKTSISQAETKKLDEKRISPESKTEVWKNKFSSLAVQLAIGLLLVLVFSGMAQTVLEDASKNIQYVVQSGLLVAIITPIIVLALLLTLIGIPVGLVIGLIYYCVLWLSPVISGMVLGKIIVDRYAPKKFRSLIAITFIGIVVLWVLSCIPVVSFICSVGSGIVSCGIVWKYFIHKNSVQSTASKK